MISRHQYSSIEFAQYIVTHALKSDNKLSVSHVQIQKWMYIIYGVYLVIHQTQLFNEQPENWPLGPVFPQLYRHIKKYGIEALKKETTEITLTPLEKEIISKVLDVFGNWSAEELTNWTHRDNTAWSKTLEKNGEFNTTMDNQSIKEEFLKIVKN